MYIVNNKDYAHDTYVSELNAHVSGGKKGFHIVAP